MPAKLFTLGEVLGPKLAERRRSTARLSLADLVGEACPNARRHLQAATFRDSHRELLVVLDHGRWVHEVSRRETLIFDRIEDAGHVRPERLVVIAMPPTAAAA